jgi:hypothetical protein
MEFTLLRDRFRKWGGIPRYVSQSDQASIETKLYTAITAMDVQLIEVYRGTPEIFEYHQNRISHMVVQYLVDVQAEYKKGKLDFASLYIAERCIATSLRARYVETVTHYYRVRNETGYGAYSGNLWEHLCLHLIPFGIPSGYKIYRLEPPQESTKPQTGSIVSQSSAAKSKFEKERSILKSSIEIREGSFGEMMTVLTAKKFFRPKTSNFPIIDAAVMEGNDIYGMNITITESHRISALEALKLCAVVPPPKKLHIVWVVDPASRSNIKRAQSFAISKKASKKVSAAQKEQLNAIPQWKLEFTFPNSSRGSH